MVAFAPNFPVLVVFRFLQGVFGKGTWMTCYVIGKSRLRLLVCLRTRLDGRDVPAGQPAGVVLLQQSSFLQTVQGQGSDSLAVKTPPKLGPTYGISHATGVNHVVITWFLALLYSRLIFLKKFHSSLIFHVFL